MGYKECSIIMSIWKRFIKNKMLQNNFKMVNKLSDKNLAKQSVYKKTKHLGDPKVKNLYINKRKMV